MSFCVIPIVAAKIGSRGADERDDQQHRLRVLEDDVGARHHVKDRR
jgi:hypothetical protein